MTIRYTEDAIINEEVSRIIDYIVNGVVQLFRPESIILSGSLGRGEATILGRNGKIEFLSDCEISPIAIKYVPKSKIDKLILEIKERFGLDLDISGIKLSIYFLVPGLSRGIKPTIQNYDFKYGSKVIYGSDYLHKIPDFKPEDIPFWEGLRLMFNRMAEYLKYLPANGEPNSRSVFWLYKVVLACQDTILLSVHRYDPSCQGRNLVFQEVFPKYFAEMNAALPKFLPLTVEATTFKLTGGSNYYNCNDLQSSVAEICDKVFRWAMKIETGMDFDSYVEFQQHYLEGLRIKAGIRFIPSTLLQNAFSLMEILLIKRSYISLKLMSKTLLPWKHTAYSMIPLIYFATTPEGHVHTSYLHRTRQVLSLFRDLDEQKSDPLAEYQYLKRETINLWYALCH